MRQRQQAGCFVLSKEHGHVACQEPMNGLAYLRAVGVTGRLARLLLQFSLAILLSHTSVGFGQNHVLELDGNGGYVELPPNIFNDLDEATVEAWVRWDDFTGEYKRVFNYGDARQDFTIGSQRDSQTLWFVVADAQRQLHEITVPNLLRTQQWCHVAAVSGKGGMRLYLDGALTGTNDYTGSFAGLKNGNRFYLGQAVTTNDPPTKFQR